MNFTTDTRRQAARRATKVAFIVLGVGLFLAFFADIMIPYGVAWVACYFSSRPSKRDRLPFGDISTAQVWLYWLATVVSCTTILETWNYLVSEGYL